MMDQEGRRTVLLAEDQAAVRSYVRKTLERAGYVVFEAENGAEATVLADEHDHGVIDLFLTDVVMPEMSGPAAVRKVRETHPELPVLYMSAFAEDEIVVDGELDPSLPFLEKPFTPDALLAAVRELIGDA